MGGSENPWDTALVMKPPLVPEQEKFLPAHLGRDGLPEGCPPSQEWRGVGGRDAGVAKFSSPYPSPGLPHLCDRLAGMFEFSARFHISDPIFEPHSHVLLVGVEGRPLGPVTGQRCSQANVIRSLFRSQPVTRGN